MAKNDKGVSRPIDAFVKHFLDIKPYHTKILEVVERYRFTETMEVSFVAIPSFKVVIANEPLCKAVGFGISFDDSCGYSTVSCCDLFDCIGGYGLIFDNSDLLVSTTILDANLQEDSVLIQGNQTYDIKAPILSNNRYGFTVDGDLSSHLSVHNLVIVSPFNVFAILNSDANSFFIRGNHEEEFNNKREFAAYGTAANDKHFAVQKATYNVEQDWTEVLVSSPESASSALTVTTHTPSGYLETYAPSHNMGAYLVKSYNVTAGKTYIETYRNDLVVAPAGGAVQLRTGLSNGRHVWLPDATDTETGEREHKIISAEFDTNANVTKLVFAEKTNIVNAGSAETPNWGQLKLYGYLNPSGFDNTEECTTPKAYNIAVNFSEALTIRVVPYITPTPSPTMTMTPSPTPVPPTYFVAGSWTGSSSKCYAFGAIEENLVALDDSTIPNNPYTVTSDSDVTYLAYGLGTDTVNIYSRSNLTVSPVTNVTVSGRFVYTGVGMSVDSNYMGVVSMLGTAPRVNMYKRFGDTFIELAGEPPTQPTTINPTNGNAYFMRWSPTGDHAIVSRRVAGTASTKSLYVYKRTGDTFAELPSQPSAPPSGTYGMQLSFTPSGDTMAVTSYTSLSSSGFLEFYTVSGDNFTLAGNLNSHFTAVSPTYCEFSPDGQYLAVGLFYGGLFIFKNVAGTWTKLDSPAGLGATGIAISQGVTWTPDGDYIVLSAVGNALKLIKRDGDTFTEVDSEAVGGIGRIGYIGMSSIEIPPTPSPSATATPTPTPTISPSESPTLLTSHFLAVAQSAVPQLKVYEKGDTSYTSVSVDTQPPSVGRGINWSNSGEYLAYPQDFTPGLSIYKATHLGLTKLTTSFPAQTLGFYAQFSPDDTHLAFSKRYSPYVIIYGRSGDTFTELTTLPDATTDNSITTLSYNADGSLLATAASGASGMPSVSIYTVSGSTYTKLVSPITTPNTTCRVATFSPAGDYLACAYGGFATSAVRVYSVSGTTFTQAFEYPEAVISKDVAWSMDGKYLAILVGNESGKTRIRVYSVIAGVFTQVFQTDYTDTGTSYVRFTKDGTQMLVTAELGGGTDQVRVYNVADESFTQLTDYTVGSLTLSTNAIGSGTLTALMPSPTPSPTVTPTPTPSPSIGGGDPYGDLILSDSPVHYWSFNNVGGSTVEDRAGSNDLTRIGGANAGISGGDGIGDGTGFVNFDYTYAENRGFQMASNVALSTSAAFTIEAWVNFATPTGSEYYSTIMGGATNGRGPEIWVHSGVDVELYWYGGAGGTDFPKAGNLNVWKHVVFVGQVGGALQIWVDGVDITDGSMTFVNVSLGFVGTDAANEAHHGLIDEVAYYDRALSGAEIIEHYNAGLSALA